MSDDETEVYERPSYRHIARQQIDVRYWMKLAVYSCLGVLLILGLIIAVAVTAMALRFLGREPAPRAPTTTTTVTVSEATVRTLPPTTIKSTG